MLTQIERTHLEAGKASPELQAKAAALIERLEKDLAVANRRIRGLNNYISDLEYDLLGGSP